jgi:Tol biopolymer transport system component
MMNDDGRGDPAGRPYDTMEGMMKLKFFVTVGLFLMLAACGPTAVSPEPETASRPTVIATAVAQPTETPTQGETAVPTALPTRTPLPRLTSEAEVLPGSDSLPPTQTPLPKPPETLKSFMSPNAEWLATVEDGLFGSTEKMILRITNQIDGSEWIAESTEKTNVSFNIPPDPIHWSPDSTFLYFVHRSFNDGCGPFTNGIDLFRINVITGEVEEVVERGSWFAFAPDGEQLAYMWRDEIFIQNLTTGGQRAVTLTITNEYDEVFLTHLVWSPDSRSVAVLAGLNICLELPATRSSIVVVDATSLAQTVVLDEHPTIVFINGWPESNILIVALSEGGQSETVQFKIDTAEFLPLETAVPEPTTFTPRFDRFLPFAYAEGGSNSLTGLVRQGDGWQLERIPYPNGLYDEAFGYALGTDSVYSDYAVATDRLIAWQFTGGGGGPGNLAVAQLFIVNIATEEVEIVADNMVSAGWAPNGLDFAYILATDETYQLRWRTAAGEDKLLAVDVPHTLKVSPDGRFVAFTRESHYEVDGTPPGLYVVEIATGRETQISPLDRAGFGGTGPFYKPHWTPDSSQVLQFAYANDGRSATPFETGYIWAAADGSSSHMLPLSSFTAFFVDEPLNNPELVRCVGGPALVAPNQIVLPVGECQPMGPANPETAQFAVFTLDPQSGEVTLTAVLSTPNTAQLLTWDTPGESVLILDDGEIVSVEIESVETE